MALNVALNRVLRGGKRNLLLQLLRKKFGELSKDLEAAIGKVDVAEQLDQLSLAVLDVTSLDEFLKLLPNSLK